MSTAETQPLSETITLTQAKSLIKCLAHDQSLLFLSPPGVGKSDTVVQALRRRRVCRAVRCWAHRSPEDVSGIPQIVGEAAPCFARREFCCRKTPSRFACFSTSCRPARLIFKRRFTRFCLSGDWANTFCRQAR